MNGQAERLQRALSLVQQAELALANAVSALREASDDDLTNHAIRLEAEACILEVHIGRAYRRTIRLSAHETHRCFEQLAQPSSHWASIGMPPR
jgi:hypothetical protein